MTLLWNEYCQIYNSNGKTPYQYTQFCEKYCQRAWVTKATMRIQHKSVDTMVVDWAGDTSLCLIHNDAGHLVFLDESGVNINLTRRYGCSIGKPE